MSSIKKKSRSTKVDAGDFKHELLNRLRSTMAVNVLRNRTGTQYATFGADIQWQEVLVAS